MNHIFILLSILMLASSCQRSDNPEPIFPEPEIVTQTEDFHSLFKNVRSGVIDWQNGMQGGDAFVGDHLNVSGYVILPIQPKNTTLKILVKGGSNAQIRLNSSDLSSFYFVYQSAGGLSIGKSGSGILANKNDVVDASKDYYM